ncbi:MAG: hypothetical protein RSA70_01920 [Clostridia bacterium]
MHNNLRTALDSVRATDDMKKNTLRYIARKTASRKRLAPLKYALAATAMLAIVIFAAALYATPVSYISVDVNPSIEFKLNRLDRVVDAKAYNDDGARVLQNLDFKNKTYTAAIELLLADKTFESYVSQDALLSITVVSDNEDALIRGIKNCRGSAQLKTECHGASAELLEKAQESGLSFGKYRAFVELSQYDKTITPQDCKSLSMRQIRDKIRAYGGNPEETGAQNGGGQGKGHGYHGGKGSGFAHKH